MALMTQVREVSFPSHQRIITYIGTNYNDEQFGQLLDGTWRAYRVNPDRAGVYKFDELVLKYDEYKISGSAGSYGIQIWMHDRPGNRFVFQIRNGRQPHLVEISLVDVDDRSFGAPNVLDLMWQEDVPGGLQETLMRFGMMAVR